MFRLPLRDGVELQLIEERHAEEIFAVVDRNREYLREWLPWVDANRGPQSTLEFVRRSLAQFAANEGFAAGIWRNGAFIGGTGFHAINWADRKVEIGYWIDREHQGRGIVKTACQALIRHAFEEWKLHRVEIRCATGNLASNKIPQRLGFRLEGTLREAQLVNGIYYDLNIYGLLASEWEKL